MARSVSQRFLVTVDYDVPLEGRIKVRRFDLVDDSIRSVNFPPCSTGQVAVELVLVHFDCRIYSENAVAELARMGYQPATLALLVAFGVQHWEGEPGLVVALGSPWEYAEGIRCVPYLSAFPHSSRNLRLDLWEEGWDNGYHFLAFPADA